MADKTLFPMKPPSTPPGSIPPDLWDEWYRLIAEWDRQGRTYTQREAEDEVGRRAEERREAALKRNPGVFG